MLVLNIFSISPSLADTSDGFFCTRFQLLTDKTDAFGMIIPPT
ncbi:hypothetical protein Nizo3400_1681 [Lactiplantibacillus plantarum]|nr:hypothetical protein Nizo3400_1681 [Lactiplantibacillus plantarum]